MGTKGGRRPTPRVGGGLSPGLYMAAGAARMWRDFCGNSIRIGPTGGRADELVTAPTPVLFRVASAGRASSGIFQHIVPKIWLQSDRCSLNCETWNVTYREYWSSIFWGWALASFPIIRKPVPPGAVWASGWIGSRNGRATVRSANFYFHSSVAPNVCGFCKSSQELTWWIWLLWRAKVPNIPILAKQINLWRINLHTSLNDFLFPSGIEWPKHLWFTGLWRAQYEIECQKKSK